MDKEKIRNQELLKKFYLGLETTEARRGKKKARCFVFFGAFVVFVVVVCLFIYSYAFFS